MQIRRKLLLGMVGLLSLMGAGIVLTVHLLILPQVEEIERNNRFTDLERVRHGIQLELDRLGSSVGDWGEWDDTYNYIRQPDKAYEESNLIDGTLEGLKLDALLIIRRDGVLMWEQFSPRADSHADIGVLRGGSRADDHPLLTSLGEMREGVLETPAGAWLIASSPILTSKGGGESQGTIAFARLIDAGFTDELSELLSLPVELSLSDEGETRPGVVFLSDDSSLAETSLGMLNSQMRLRIRIQQPRPFYQQALAAINYAVTTIFAIGLLVSLFAYGLIKSTLVNPLLLLQRQAEAFGQGNKSSVFKPLQRDDELGELARSFVRMASNLESSRDELENERNRLRDASLTDPLTRLKNRRYLERFLRDESVWLPRQEWLFLMLDCDHFKDVNDRYGHDTGDIVLGQLAQLLQDLSRQQDIVVRYGGEEFALICKQADEQIGCAMAERIRQQVEASRFGHPHEPISLTCSIGFFTLRAEVSGQPQQEWRSMLKVADLALYAAKNSGRNSWVGLKCLCDPPEVCFPKENVQVLRYISDQRLATFSSLSGDDGISW